MTSLILGLWLAVLCPGAEGGERKVRYEELLPHELAAAIKERPVAYVPYGSLEWHGRHLPYGVDGLKAHLLCEAAARKYGGVVLPVTYWQRGGASLTGTYHGAPEGAVEELFTGVFRWLASLGFKVIVGVAGHDVPEQLAPLEKAAKAVTVEGLTYGVATYEFLPGEPWSDHAAAYETSLMMVLRPELVSLDRIKAEELVTDRGKSAAGIWGEDPRVHASKRKGEADAARLVRGLGTLPDDLLRKVRE
ncbi:MAG: creatininase family protein [Elusimicrobia bacterium]|nr:creatininase family protein [Elusimicrobiota bacterium]